jgi:NADPH:quinone reductase-like Zn-dependent oxidoreductase
MRAIVYDPDAPHGLRLGMAPDPVPASHEALVEVHAIALNFGEVAFLAERRKPGEVIGWECAGVVLEAAADGVLAARRLLLCDCVLDARPDDDLGDDYTLAVESSRW